jgi:enoyl-CoA hydratase/carnithine racemase
MIDYTKEGDLHLVTMNAGPNVICPAWQKRMLDILDTVEADCGKGAALILTGDDKFFCNGLNLEVVTQLAPEEMVLFASRMAEIHKRFLLLPCPTVAAVNGHAFAAGAFMALSCDYRIMREDRGWFSVSEVDVGVPIPAPMMGILQGKLPANTARDAVLIGKRYTADEAIAAGIADGKAPVDELMKQAKTLASQLGTKEPGIFKTLKQTCFGPMAEAVVAG